MSELRNLMRTITKNNNNVYSKICVIRDAPNTTNNTCTVEPIDEPDFNISVGNVNNYIYDVRYSPSPDVSVNEPSPNSLVMVTFFDNQNAYITMFSENRSLNLKDTQTGASNSITTTDGKLQINSADLAIRDKHYTGSSYKGNGFNINSDFRSNSHRSECGSILTIDCDIHISPKEKVFIGKRSFLPINNKQNNITYVKKTSDPVADKKNEDAYKALTEMNFLIINIVYRADMIDADKESNKGKVSLFKEVIFPEFDVKYATEIPLFQSTYNSLKKYFTTQPKYGFITADKVLEQEIITENTLKILSGNSDNIQALDTEIVISYNIFKNIVLSHINKNVRDSNSLGILLFYLYKFRLTDGNSLFFIDTYIKVLEELTTSKFLKSYDKNLIAIIEAGENNFNNISDVTAYDTYIKTEKENIAQYQTSDVIVSLKTILDDFKDVINTFINDVKTLSTTNCIVNAPQLGAPAFQAAALQRINELNTISTDIDSLLL